MVELLDLTLRELIEDYSLIMSLECDYIYGIAKDSDFMKIFKEYDLDDNLSFCAELIFPEALDLEEGVLSLEKMHEIVECLGVESRNDCS